MESFGIKDTLSKFQIPENHHYRSICSDKHADGNEKEFYSSLQTVVNNAPNRDILLVTGNLNSKLGLERTGREKSDPMELELGMKMVSYLLTFVQLMVWLWAEHSFRISLANTNWRYRNPNRSHFYGSKIEIIPTRCMSKNISSNHNLLFSEIRLKLCAQKRTEAKRK